MKEGHTQDPEPFFQTPAAPDRDRLLLISYHFPPGQATGALRWQQLSNFAAERGWSLDVVSCDPAHLGNTDESRLEKLPPGVRIFGVPPADRPLIDRAVEGGWSLLRRLRERREGSRSGASSNGRLAEKGPARVRRDGIRRHELRWLPRSPRDLIRAYYAWLEFSEGGRWAKRAADLATRIGAGDGRLRAVIACGPPNMKCYEAGRLASIRLGLPFIMDMRDPWSTVPRLHEALASPIWYALAGLHERRAVERSALIVSNTAPAMLALRERYPEKADRMITVMNGIDDDPIPPPRPGDRFVVAYAGAIYMNRDPRILFRAAARLISELGLTPAEFGIEFMGQVELLHDTPIEALAREKGIGDFVRLHPPGPRHAALEFLSGAAVLISLPQDDETAIPSKVFDYMRYHAWILALVERDTATEMVLRGTGADVVAPDDLDGLTNLLRERFLEFRAGIRPTPIAERAEGLSRRAQAEILFNTLEGALAGARGERCSRQRA